MGYGGKEFFRIDLGEYKVDQPCDTHKTGDNPGYDSDCDACVAIPPRVVKVPHLTGYWAELKNPDRLPWGEKKTLYAPVAGLPEGATPAERQEWTDRHQARRERVIAGLVTAWNIIPADPADGEEILPLPKVDDRSLDRAPDIVNQLWAGLNRAVREAQQETFPKAPATV